MSVALITLSTEGAALLTVLARGLGGADFFVHESVAPPPDGGRTFSSVLELTGEIFGKYRGLVYIAPCGVVVRAIAPHVRHKLKDPAVVVTDIMARHAVSLLSGHEGGANDLAFAVSNILGAEPVITTTSEAQKRIIVGVGCRRGARAEEIVDAITHGLAMVGLKPGDVRLLASADIKADEAGLLEAARGLGLPLRFIASEEIRATTIQFEASDFVQSKVELPAVAEPAALLAGRRTRLLLPRTIINSVTVAVAREDSSSLALAPVHPWIAPDAPNKL